MSPLQGEKLASATSRSHLKTCAAGVRCRPQRLSFSTASLPSLHFSLPTFTLLGSSFSLLLAQLLSFGVLGSLLIPVVFLICQFRSFLLSPSGCHHEQSGGHASCPSSFLRDLSILSLPYKYDSLFVERCFWFLRLDVVL